MDQVKKNIFINFDDKIYNSYESIVEVLNKKYKTNKKYSDLKDKNFRSIYKNITKSEIELLKNSEDYIKNLKLEKDFIHFIEKIKNKYNIIINNTRKSDSEINFLKQNNINTQKTYENIEKYIVICDESETAIHENCKIKILFVTNKPWNHEDLIYGEDIYTSYSWDDVLNLIEYYGE